MRDHLLLYINGRAVRVGGEDAFLSLSDYLRRRQRLIGTKVVCAEGDCGSCSVLLGRVEPGAPRKLRYAAVTSCIQMMLQLDATHVVTVEGLRDGDELNPIQEALVTCQGTQCGFCTPGFVVAMYDAMRDGGACDAHSVRRSLVGNLCRCTGYDSIVRAAMATDRAGLKSLDELYPPGPIVAALSAEEDVLIEVGGRKVYKPVTVDQAVRFRAENPGAVAVAGATDLGVLQNKRVRTLDVAASIAGLAELRAIRAADGVLTVGATATLTEFERATLEHLPELGRFMAWFGSPLIKNAGTLAGNLVTGSPIGDTLPALTVLGATIELAATSGGRSVPIGEFYTGYRTTVLRPDEIVTAVRIPLLEPGDTFRLYKASRRRDLDIAGFGAAILMRQAAGAIDDIRIAYGGVGPMVMRMTKTEAALRGKPAALDLFEHAARIARDEVTPISDVRGSEQYRRTLAANILLKFWHETVGGDDANGNGAGDVSPTPGSVPGLREPALVHYPERQA